MAASLACRLGLIVVILESAPCISFVLFQRTRDEERAESRQERNGANRETAGRKRETEVTEEPRHNESPNVAKMPVVYSRDDTTEAPTRNDNCRYPATPPAVPRAVSS